ncbi:MAG: helix-turn-helix domain-containing protein [Spirochaetota bacterium]
MSEKENEEYSIIRIAYDAGFNSKSTFNTIFKKMIGVTPSEFRQSGRSEAGKQ